MDLSVRCDRRPDAARGETDPRKLYYDSNVYSGMMVWKPVGDQKNAFRGQEPRPVVDDILLTKLRPGQVSLDYSVYLVVIWLMGRWSISTALQRKEQGQITPSGLQSVSCLDRPPLLSQN